MPRSGEVIDLCSDSDREATPVRRPTKRARLLPPLLPNNASSGSDLEIVSHIVRGATTQDLSQTAVPAPRPQPRNASAADGDIAVVGARTTLQALVDYPHFRFQCATEAFKRKRASQKERYCERCFCYVCDVPAADCRRWKTHSKAVDSATRWRAERELNLEARRQAHAAQPSARRTLPARHVRPSPILQSIPDDFSLGSSVEEVVMDNAHGLLSDSSEPSMPHIPFEEACRVLEALDLETDLFAMRPLACALDDAAVEDRPVHTGAVLRSRSRRTATRQAGAG